MQYGLSNMRYKKIKGEIEEKTKVIVNSKVLLLMGLFLVGVFVSRVELMEGVYPFGLAISFAVMNKVDSEKMFFVSSGSVVGYLLGFVPVGVLPGYIISTVVIFAANFVRKNSSKDKIRTAVVMGMVAVAMYANFILDRNYYVGAVTTALVLVLCFASIFLFDEIIDKLLKKKKNFCFSNEELISLCILASVIIAGMGGIKIFTFSLSNILALTTAMLIGYISGPANGAVFGVVLGIMVGLGNFNLGIYVLTYASVGIISGIFKDINKTIVGVSVAIIYFILVMFYKDYGFNGRDGWIAIGIFLFISKDMYSSLKEYFKSNGYEDDGKNVNLRVKEVYKNKLGEFSGILGNISEILTDLNNNDKLVMKNKSTAMVQKLADRVCSDCQLKNNCWRREMHYTYSAFVELLVNYENNRGKMPDLLGIKCINKDKLEMNAEDIVNRNLISELKKSTISEGREVLSNQIKNMAESMESIVDDFDVVVKVDSKLQERLKRAFIAERIKVREIVCLVNGDGRTSIKVEANACGGEHRCVKKLLPIINEISGKKFCVSNDGCEIQEVMKTCSIGFEEIPKFHVAHYGVQKCKDGERENGDSFKFIKNKKNRFMSVISDGMGSGPEAKRESESAVKLIERFSKAGIKEDVAINTINSVMAMKYKTQETFSTLDIASLDLYNGVVDFYKVGSNESFVKNIHGEVSVVDSKSLPIGVLDTVDIEKRSRKLQDGDIIVMLSDGVLDYGEKTYGEHWVMRHLKGTEENNPKEIAMSILNEALKGEDYKVKDDMTISVVKVYAIN